MRFRRNKIRRKSFLEGMLMKRTAYPEIYKDKYSSQIQPAKIFVWKTNLRFFRATKRANKMLNFQSFLVKDKDKSDHSKDYSKLLECVFEYITKQRFSLKIYHLIYSVYLLDLSFSIKCGKLIRKK